jgi:hypothetical protein
VGKLKTIIKLNISKLTISNLKKKRERSSWRVITMRTELQGRTLGPIMEITSIVLGKEEMVVHL